MSPWTIWIEADATRTCRAIDQMDDMILVRRPGVLVDPDYPNELAIPGTVVTYTFNVSNTGYTTDTYTMTWTTLPNPARASTSWMKTWPGSSGLAVVSGCPRMARGTGEPSQGCLMVAMSSL